MKKFDSAMIGKRVRFISEEDRKVSPCYYPPVGTVGKVLEEDEDSYFVKWPCDSGVDKGPDDDKYCWYCYKSSVELVEEPVKHLTDDEIVEMLMPKLEKNNIRLTYGFYSYQTLKKAVALIYRIGYGRGQKGRPFEYQNVQNVQKDEVKTEPKKNNLIGKKVVLTNPDEASLANGWVKGIVGRIARNYDNNSNCVLVKFNNCDSDVFYKSELMLIVNDNPEKVVPLC